MNRKPEIKAAANMLMKAFAAQGVTFQYQAALNLAATLEGFESFAHFKAAQSVKPMGADAAQEFTVHLIFGEEELDELREAEESDDEEDMASALAHAKTFTFASEPLLDAFMEGVEEACGWMDHKNVTDEVKAQQAA